jgi:hypothetical protein
MGADNTSDWQKCPYARPALLSNVQRILSKKLLELHMLG